MYILTHTVVTPIGLGWIILTSHEFWFPHTLTLFFYKCEAHLCWGDVITYQMAILSLMRPGRTQEVNDMYYNSDIHQRPGTLGSQVTLHQPTHFVWRRVEGGEKDLLENSLGRDNDVVFRAKAGSQAEKEYVFYLRVYITSSHFSRRGSPPFIYCRKKHIKKRPAWTHFVYLVLCKCFSFFVLYHMIVFLSQLGKTKLCIVTA